MTLPPLATISAVVIAVSALCNVMLYNFWQGAKDELRTFQLQVDLASAQAESINAKRLRDAQAVIADTANGWAAAVGVIRADSDQRMRKAERDRKALSGATATAALTHAATVESPACPGESAPSEVELNAIQDAAQVLWLQHYIKGACR